MVRGAGAVARGVAWTTGAFDRFVVDGAVNTDADVVLGAGRSLRRTQTGRIKNNVLGVTLGLVLLVLLASWL